MGGSNSKSTASNFNQVVTQAVSRNIQKCVATAVQNQNINIKAGVGDITLRNIDMSQTSVINMSCLQQTLNNSDVQNSIVNDVLQNTSTDTYAMLDALTASNTSSSSTISNITRNMFTSENISSTINEINQQQSINLETSVGNVVLENINMSQGAQIIAQTLADNANVLKTMTELENSTDQTTTMTAEGPFDFITDALTEFGWIIGIVVIVIILIVAGLLAWRWRSKSGGEGGIITVFGGCDSCGGEKFDDTVGGIGGILGGAIEMLGGSL